MGQVFKVLRVLACALPLLVTATAHAKTFVFEDSAGSFEIDGLGSKTQAEAFFNARVAENEINHASCLANPGAFSIPSGTSASAACGAYQYSFERPNQRDVNGMFYRAMGTYLPDEFEYFYAAELESAIRDNAVNGWITDGLRVTGPMFADMTYSGLNSIGGFDETHNPAIRGIIFDRPMTLGSIDLSIYLQAGAPTAFGIFDLVASSTVDNFMKTISFDGPLDETYLFGDDYKNVTSLMLKTNLAVSHARPAAFREGGVSFNNLVATVSPSNVPLPAGVWLMVLGLVSLGHIARRGNHRI